MTDDTAIRIQHVDVLFGSSSQQKQALQLLDQAHSREDILTATGAVLGVSDASLDIALGSVSVLMGLSGSGKSSLLRCINGLNTVTRGDIHISTADGIVNVASCKGRSLRHIRRHHLAMVFQQFALLPWATVRDNIAFGLSVRGEAPSVVEQKVNQQLELVGLAAWADKPIHTLSGGMQQRVGLARAFATDADILLMDEPFSALDPLIREHLQDELLALQSRLKKTIVFVSHDLDEALKLGNQISIMESGRIVQTGTANDIVFSPATDYVSRFVANINPLSVLTAETIMQPAHITDSGLYHAKSGLHVVLNSLKPASATIHHRKQTLHTNITDPTILQRLSNREQSQALYCVTPDTPIRLLLALITSNQSPVVVVDTAGQIKGLVDALDIVQALHGGSAMKRPENSDRR